MSDCIKIIELESRITALEAKIKRLEELLETPITQKEAASYLHISRHTIKRHTEMGLLSAIPGTTKYLVSELDRYKAKRQRSK